MLQQIVQDTNQRVGEVVKEVHKTLTTTLRGVTPQRPTRAIPPAAQLHRFLSATPEQLEARRQEWGEGVFRAYCHAMAKLYQGQRGM